MPRKRYKPEEIVSKLRQVDALTSQGRGVSDAIPQIGVTEVIDYPWRREFGGLKRDQVRHLREPRAGESSAAAGGLRPDSGTS
jgi:hypothetical protein